MKTASNYARSIRYAGLVTLIAAASGVQACSSDKIVAAPSGVTRPSAPSAPASPAFTQGRVSGTVTNDEGVAVAGVKVTVYSWPNGGPASLAITDGMGFYSVSFLPASGISSISGTSGISAFTEKSGYESKWHTRSGSVATGFQFDLRIHRTRQ